MSLDMANSSLRAEEFRKANEVRRVGRLRPAMHGVLFVSALTQLDGLTIKTRKLTGQA